MIVLVILSHVPPHFVNILNKARFELKTAGSPKRIRLLADRTNINASRNDLSYVMVEITDDIGQVIPGAEKLIQFSITGAGETAGVGNASPREITSFPKPERKTVNGKCLVIIRSSGKSGIITLKATASGLTPAQIIITTRR